MSRFGHNMGTKFGSEQAIALSINKLYRLGGEQVNLNTSLWTNY